VRWAIKNLRGSETKGASRGEEKRKVKELEGEGRRGGDERET